MGEDISTDRLTELLEELLAVQVMDIATRLQAQQARGEDALDKRYLDEAVRLVRRNKEAILEGLRRPAEPEPREDGPGERGNLEKAKRMSMKQKRYDLAKGLF